MYMLRINTVGHSIEGCEFHSFQKTPNLFYRQNLVYYDFHG